MHPPIAPAEDTTRLQRLILALVAAVRRMDHHRLFAWTLQIAVFCVSGLTAFILRFEFALPRKELTAVFWGMAVWVVLKAAMFRLYGLDHGWWKFVSVSDVFRITAANLAGSAASVPLLTMLVPGFPRSVYILDFILCLLASAGVRILTRLACEIADRARSAPGGKSILLYGAGRLGELLLREIHLNPHLGYRVKGFVDDDGSKTGLDIQGIRVLGTGARLPALVAQHGVQEVFLTLPAVGATKIAAILESCRAAGARCRTVPSLAHSLNGAGLANQIRDVAVEDLLGREPVHLETAQIRDKLEAKTVVVTGAAGSIGSELCRQIARFHPRAIVAYDIGENALFELEREMKASFPQTPLHPEIGSVQNPRRLAEVFKRHRPSILYHAAAYKHVPLMEQHPFEAVANNVFGTYHTARLAIAHGVGDFVMISTDKAVRPTSIMGVSKRIAELVVYSLESEATKLVSVRFGNVLGSNGSALRIFKEQIAAGGPVTVTHPDMRRYFMTIPEAAQLVLQASTMGHRREIFVLEMGAQIKIVDLARSLVLLSGLRPDKEIPIVFNGTRPGEKLYEELSTIEENTAPTTHSKIRIFQGSGLSEEELKLHLETLTEICWAGDISGLLLKLKEIVPDYSPSAYLLQKVLPPRSPMQERTEECLAVS